MSYALKRGSKSRLNAAGGKTARLSGERKQEMYRVFGGARAPAAAAEAHVAPPPASAEAWAEMQSDLDNFSRQAGLPVCPGLFFRWKVSEERGGGNGYCSRLELELEGTKGALPNILARCIQAILVVCII